MKRFQSQPGFVVQAYRFALDPNAAQEYALRSHCGAARAAYNWAVGWVSASWWQRRAEETYGVPEADLTTWRPWSLPSLRKAFNAAKHTDPRFASWWEENSKEAYNTGLANAAAAFDNYAKSRQGRRMGKRVGMPRFKPEWIAEGGKQVVPLVSRARTDEHLSSRLIAGSRRTCHTYLIASRLSDAASGRPEIEIPATSTAVASGP
ncbi:helix-turn-helix domain-containing protein [Streptomyces sp. NPDC127066]|uniref:helix-turn-helix domain-containing protein n=1 Tax=Streptomyces sp. NPDC127066 TaxID=3347125 RepID=UPI003653600E